MVSTCSADNPHKLCALAPAEMMRPELADRGELLLVSHLADAEQIAEVRGLAVPVLALKGRRHKERDRSTPCHCRGRGRKSIAAHSGRIDLRIPRCCRLRPCDCFASPGTPTTMTVVAFLTTAVPVRFDWSFEGKCRSRSQAPAEFHHARACANAHHCRSWFVGP